MVSWVCHSNKQNTQRQKESNTPTTHHKCCLQHSVPSHAHSCNCQLYHSAAAIKLHAGALLLDGEEAAIWQRSNRKSALSATAD
jgi:hypothetical protein